MAIDVFVPAVLFFTPCWEPSDSSVVEHPATGRFQIFCNYSQRLVALTDTVEEADLLLLRTRLHCARNEPPVSPDLAEFYAPRLAAQIAGMEARLAELGHPDGDMVPEIVAGNRMVEESSAAATVRRLLGDGDLVEFALPHPDLREVLDFLFSDMAGGEAKADVLIDKGTAARIKVTYDGSQRPVGLEIRREFLLFDYYSYIPESLVA